MSMEIQPLAVDLILFIQADKVEFFCKLVNIFHCKAIIQIYIAMRLNTTHRLLMLVFILMFPNYGHAQDWNINSDQWVATDGLGRELTDDSETGSVKKEKFIGMFYWTWHTDNLAAFNPVMNITEILEEYPEAVSDKDHAAWKGIEGGVFWWDEPLFGYYRTTDEWILRKHAEMLADAGVDVVFFDCTNGTYTWKTSYTILLEVWNQARLDGVKTPQIVFLLPFGASSNSLVSLYELYTELYQPEIYKDLWFMWDDKPLIMAYPESLVPTSDGTAGLKFTATESFYAINATCPSWNNSIGNLTFSLYHWDTNYAHSIAATPIADSTIVNFNDNEKIMLSFDAQEAGEYLWVLSNGVEEVGVWKWTDSTDPAVSFFSGIEVDGNYESEISYNPEFNFTRLTNGTNHAAISITGSMDHQTIIDIKNFFTFRPGQPDYVNGPSRDDQWGWLENSPQHGYAPKPDGGFEQATVGVAQNACDASGGHAAGFNNPFSYGRSYTKAAGQDSRPEAYFEGLNFQEQWNGAFEIDPDLIFITGWNEWTAGRHFNWDVQPFAFVDQYSAEKSRDIEPAKSWGNKGDTYYMQLVSNVRKFKGMEKSDTASVAKTIDMNDPASWTDVKPEYLSYKGNTMHRDHPGQGSELIYTNTTGRNDIISAKVSRDSEFVYFHVETADILSDKSDPKWMRLFIDIDRDRSTGWEGYDFIVNKVNPEDSAIVEKSENSWDWIATGKAGYIIDGNTLVLKIKRSVLDLDIEKVINFEFKWSDNMQEDGNIMDFYVNGDVAPGARFNYVYKVNWSDDRYLYADTPKGINQGLICEQYEGIFDTIPSFFEEELTETYYLNEFEIPTNDLSNYGLNYSGFIDIPAKDEYTFTLNADMTAKLFIGNELVVISENAQGEQIGSMNLMPGKHPVKLEYITIEGNTPMLEIMMESSSLSKNSIPPSMLFKYNQKPEISIEFKDIQNFYSPIDTVIIIKTSDPDGSIAKIEIFDNDQLIAEETSLKFTINNLDIGLHSIMAIVTDNDGAVNETRPMEFTVNTPIPIPGIISPEEFRNGNSVIIIDSDDIDEGFSIKAAYGWTDYAIDVEQAGLYNFSFRVPSYSSTKNMIVKVNNIEIETVDLGNNETTDPWVDVNAEIMLDEGIQILGFDYNNLITLHKVSISYLGTSIKSEFEGVVMISPNPSANDFLIQTPKSVNSIVVFDMLGQMAEQLVLNHESYTNKFGSELQPGIYILIVTGNDGSRKSVKIVKE